MNNEMFDKLLDEVISNRTEEFYMEQMDDEEGKKYINIMSVVAKRHGLTFKELLSIQMEMAILSQSKE